MSATKVLVRVGERLFQFTTACPLVQIEFSASHEHFSLRRIGDDVAIRIADAVPYSPVGRRLGDVQFKVYELRRGRSRSFLREAKLWGLEPGWNGFERDARDLESERWLIEHVPPASVSLRVDVFSHELALGRAGLGRTLLSSFVFSCRTGCAGTAVCWPVRRTTVAPNGTAQRLKSAHCQKSGFATRPGNHSAHAHQTRQHQRIGAWLWYGGNVGQNQVVSRRPRKPDTQGLNRSDLQ